MSTTALYHWSVAGSPIDVLIDLPLVDQLRVASATSTHEIGGILLGHFDGNYTVITGFEAVESEHRRGTAYTLSKRDESRLGARLEARRKKRGDESPVGFFRSHLRPGMFLDEGDNQVISTFFPSANNVTLLIRPGADRSATGGFFFWEDGEINRKQTYLPFPMSSQELDKGDFPIVEPVASAIPGNAASAINTASTISGDPGRAIETDAAEFSNAETIDPAPVMTPRDAVRETSLPALRRPATINREKLLSSGSNRRSWQVVGLVAVAAAFGGYLIGTSSTHRDHFGARDGDITLNSDPEVPAPPKPVVTVPVAPGATASKQAPDSATPAPNRTPGSPAPEGAKTTVKADPDVAGASPAGVAAKPVAAPTKLVIAKAEPRSTLPGRPQSELAPSPRRTAEEAVGSSPQGQSTENTPGWQHFHTAQPTSASQVAEAELPTPSNQAPSRPVVRAAPVAVSSVYLEAVEAGGVSRAFSKIPLFGSLHRAQGGTAFTPPQVVRSSAPPVPADLARELTGTLPVDLRLKVDSRGHVSSVEVISHQTAAEFVRLAGDAAYDWQFEPARVRDKAVASDVIAHFKFRPQL